MASRVWPLLGCVADFTGGPPGLPGGNAVDLLGPGTPVALRQWGTSRGRQYELGTVQTGTLTMGIDDPREYLNPVNTSSPWNSGGKTLLPYRRIQMVALWRPSTMDATGNILNSTNYPAGTFTTTFDPSFEARLGGWFAIAGSPTVALSTAQHFDGAQSMAVTYGASGDAAGIGIYHLPGRQHTVSLYVFVPASHTVTVTWQAPFYGSPTIATATSSTTGAWQRLTLTATPAAWSSVVSITCSAAYPATVYVDAYQLELGASASTFTTSGPTFLPQYTGYIERYPQEWDMAGFRGKRPLQAVDALSPLSRTVISQSYASTILADGPKVYIPYNDQSFPQTITLPSGGQPGVGYQQLGANSGAVTFSGDTFPDGSRAVSIAQPNTNPVTSANNTFVTYIGTYNLAVLLDPSSFTMEFWYRWTDGSIAVGAATMQPGESTVGEVIAPNRPLFMYNLNNFLAIQWIDNSGTTRFTYGLSSLGKPLAIDSKWHHIVISLANISGTYSYRWAVDGGTVTSWTALGGGGVPPVQALNNFFANAAGYWGDPASSISVANQACYGTVLSQSQITAHYKRGAGYLGEKSGTRALRLLTQYWSTAVVTDTGVTSMATDFSYNGRAMLDVLQEIADSEFGLVWADAAGLVHQDSRETRYTTATSVTAQYVFGENSAGGELPYETVAYDYDPTYVYSQANFTSGGSGTQQPAVINSTSQTAYGQRILSKTLQTAVDWDAQQAAKFIVGTPTNPGRYAKPAGAPGTTVPPRITAMTINPAANPALWTAALSMDIGWRVTVKRRTSAGVVISGDYYIEKIDHAVNGDAGTWTVTYQLSPVFVSQAWALGDSVKGVLGTTSVCVY